MKKTILITLMLILISGVSAQDLDFQFFPSKKLYSKSYADALEHQFSLNKQMETAQWNGNIGGYLPIVDITLNKKNTLQVTVASTVFNTLIISGKHIQVYTVDYQLDFYGDIKLKENTVFRFVWGHLSAHYSDDGITELGFSPISYVRDYCGMKLQQQLPSLNGKIYAGAVYNFHNEPRTDRHMTYTIGGDAAYKISNSFYLYGAVDIKIKSEVFFGTTQSFQVGLRSKEINGISFRLAYTHRRGFEERGQIYDQKDIKNSVGFYFDF
ncbi:MAG: hypothetical protein ACEPO8_11050 [Rhodothermaceae bacterium]